MLSPPGEVPKDRASFSLALGRLGERGENLGTSVSPCSEHHVQQAWWHSMGQDQDHPVPGRLGRDSGCSSTESVRSWELTKHGSLFGSSSSTYSSGLLSR